jgi:aminoglycoside phosphotransferase (APT) family kinase protein
VTDGDSVLIGDRALAPETQQDLTRVLAWMDRNGIGSGDARDPAPVGGGTQNVMVSFSRGSSSYVMRRGPRHLRSTSNDSLVREMEVLDALASTDVPHPRLLASCADTTILGDSVFYLMEPVDGVNAFVEISDVHRDDAQVRHQIGLEVVDALVALGEVDPDAVGLGHLGHPDGWLERQVGQWLAELRRYDGVHGYQRAVPHVEEVARWLDEHGPAANRPGLMHGDYHLGNVMLDRRGPQVAAVVDWEMCTVADPLLDLGWLLATWQQPDGTDLTGSRLAAAGTLATADELVAHYARQSDRDLTHLLWYRVLACFKLGILLEGTYARSLTGRAPAALGNWMHIRTVSLFEQAHQLLG